MAKRDPKPALLVRVLTEIGRGKITEGFISDKDHFTHGETDGKHIWINPAVAVVDTVIHEVLHRLEPGWHEYYVRRTTTFLMRRMSEAQIQQLYETYQQIAKRKRVRRRRGTADRGHGAGSDSGVSVADTPHNEGIGERGGRTGAPGSDV
jgi:hypothetical protein